MSEDFSKYNGEGTILRKAQLRMLDILVEIDKICTKHNIDYWLDYGTLLGAVRHSGFIPWDDDLDIGVLRKDYKRLLTILEKELPEQYFVQNRKNEKHYPYGWSKIVDKKSTIVSVEEVSVESNGLFIDVFPLEKGNLHIKKGIEFFYGRAFRRIRMYGHKNIKVTIPEYILSLLAWPIVSLIVVLIRSISSLFFNKNLIYSYGIGLMKSHSIAAVFPLKKIQFEGKTFRCPNNNDIYLAETYGNYMKIPNEADRQIHFNDIKFLD